MSKQKQPIDDTTVTPSSGNVFADLGLKDADILMAQSVRAIHIKRAIKAFDLTRLKRLRATAKTRPRSSGCCQRRLRRN